MSVVSVDRALLKRPAKLMAVRRRHDEATVLNLSAMIPRVDQSCPHGACLGIFIFQSLAKAVRDL